MSVELSADVELRAGTMKSQVQGLQLEFWIYRLY